MIIISTGPPFGDEDSALFRQDLDHAKNTDELGGTFFAHRPLVRHTQPWNTAPRNIY